MINEIYRIRFDKNTWSYIGTLRNEKKFNLNDHVFFAINGNEIARGTICGVELPPEENPEYRYKIKLPEDLIRQRMGDDFWKEKPDFDKVTLTCDRIFNSIEEAEESAIKNLELDYKIQKENIERYFKRLRGPEKPKSKFDKRLNDALKQAEEKRNEIL